MKRYRGLNPLFLNALYILVYFEKKDGTQFIQKLIRIESGISKTLSIILF